MSGLIMLLPHGYAGQGPEHSSARLERFLQMCAEYNMTVANITSPANFFHVIRRQLERPFRKPLVIMSPKSLLRHPSCVSDISDIETGNGFKELIDDATFTSGKGVKRVILCTGKIYFDLIAKRKDLGKEKEFAIVRLEQLYPLPSDQIDAVIEKYKGAELMWVQEEPGNMGAWQYILSFLYKQGIQLTSRKTSASPATGFKKQHDLEQEAVLEKAFA
jgi:2-oxoglutarate dehydrogenase E1 component